MGAVAAGHHRGRRVRPHSRRAVLDFQPRIPRTSFDQFNVGIATVISATTHGVREHAIGGDYWGTHHLGARRY